MFAEASQLSYGSERDKYLWGAEPAQTGKRSGFPFAVTKHRFQQSTRNSRVSEEPQPSAVHPPAEGAEMPPPGFYGSWCTSAPSALWEGAAAAPYNPAMWHGAGALSQEEFLCSQAPVAEFCQMCVGEQEEGDGSAQTHPRKEVFIELWGLAEE